MAFQQSDWVALCAAIGTNTVDVYLGTYIYNNMPGYPRLQLTLPLHVCVLCPLQGRGRDMDSAESELVAYDADHERRRKSQLERLYNRTPEQVPYRQTDR